LIRSGHFSRSALAKLVDDVGALLRPTGDPHRAAALQLGDLPHHLAHPAGGGGDDHGLALLQLAHFEQAEVRGQPRHAKRPQMDWKGRLRGIDLEDSLAVGERVLLHPEEAQDVFALAEPGMFRAHDLSRAVGAHHLADLDWFGIRAALIHPAPHRRIE
jgi:hypothetical protein